MPRMADVANTWPLEPTHNTTTDATTTMRSVNKKCQEGFVPTTELKRRVQSYNNEGKADYQSLA